MIKIKEIIAPMDELIVKHADNFSFVEDNSIDLILTDPPFNISKETNFHTYKNNKIHSYKFDENSDKSWDTYNHEEFLELLNKWAKNWNRVLKNDGNFAIFVADVYISHLMEALKSNGLMPRRLFVWNKNNAVPVNRKYMPMSANEYIIVGVKKGGATFNSDIPIIEQNLDNVIIESTIIAEKVSSIVNSKLRKQLEKELMNKDGDLFNKPHEEKVEEIIEKTLNNVKNEAIDKVSKMYKKDKDGETYFQACVPNLVSFPLKTGNRIHKTEKPVNLLQYFISLYSKPGDVILDCFAGSGSTGKASLLLDRKPILIEREENHYNQIVKRLNNC